ncbi:hypothetical protein P152DRAFT_181193 [Eremomyces bilateralis CBS 781.70]|uniref:Glycine-rich cell wall structural protein 1 n=1 Tax=Eremomyces bilateralis CBS 781.70 TaxID=1392243 RepID=A0A6G1GBT2_9PEZI|nr:uncharacterized protein P152DRAFT_181193 [Eremomyces bilateralis CBS 781.70]KAF1815299.1 hypothetical protein P152DRAFT_181193 [Eremomyces bilateralis CBS 781.70]
METLSNVASNVSTSAQKILWGEQAGQQQNETGGIEPLSGEKGRGTLDSPFDKGNEDPSEVGPSAASASSASSFPSASSTSSVYSAVSDPSASSSQSAFMAPGTTGISTAPGDLTAPGASTGAKTPTGPKAPRAAEAPTAAAASATTDAPTAPSAPSAPAASSNPSTSATAGAGHEVGSADPSTAQKPTQKHQGADRPTEEPSGEDANPEQIMAKRGPNDHSGEPMRTHDGTEHRDEREGETNTTKNENEGTGQQHVKTTGLAAEGGDFDATMPGAGTEASRIKNKKGISEGVTGQTDLTAPSDSHKGAGGSGSPMKRSDRLREKLHIHKH